MGQKTHELQARKWLNILHVGNFWNMSMKFKCTKVFINLNLFTTNHEQVHLDYTLCFPLYKFSCFKNNFYHKSIKKNNFMSLDSNVKKSEYFRFFKLCIILDYDTYKHYKYTRLSKYFNFI